MKTRSRTGIHCFIDHYLPSTSDKSINTCHPLSLPIQISKMLFKFVIAAAALQVGLVAAMGKSVLVNRCPYDIWAWSVDQNGSSKTIRVPSRTKYTEPLRSTCSGCGTSLKISKTSQLLGGAQTQFEYSIVNNQLWYDISFVDCANGQNANSCPGHDLGLTMDSPEPACGKAKCAPGTYCPTASYYVDFPLKKLGLRDPVFTCPGKGTDMDLIMTVCSGQPSLKRSIAGRIAVDLIH